MTAKTPLRREPASFLEFAPATAWASSGAPRLSGEVGRPQRAHAATAHVLLASAPFGPFGRELASALRARGARCSRVLLNGGDVLDWGARDGFAYRGGPDGWARWLRDLILREGVTDLVAYGDSTLYAAAAIEVAAELGLRQHVLEQGYVRPDWVTLERGGVNANSRLPRDPAWWLATASTITRTADRQVGRAAPSAVLWISLHHLARYAGAPIFPRFRAGYGQPAALQAVGHAARFIARAVRSRDRLPTAITQPAGPLFLALLQRPGDSQLWRHSSYARIEDFLDRVIASFAALAPTDARLIVRPHPLDPGLEPHGRTLARIAARAGVSDRVTLVDGGKLHEILPHIDGAICVNSTAGLAAIEFGRPTVVLGQAIYDMPGLTHQGGLDAFWLRPEPPSRALHDAFRKVVLATTQVNGAFATRRGRAMAVPEIADRLLAAGG